MASPRVLLGILGFCLGIYGQIVNAATLRIAVAANFKSTLEQLVADYRFHKQAEGSRVSGLPDIQVISGSTGVLYAQISHGAPYQILLAADSQRPQALEQAGAIVPDSRRTYAVGRLVFWQPARSAIHKETIVVNEETLRMFQGPLAIANPELAPYGRAAQQAMDKLKPDQTEFVTGNNISQTFQFIATGNVAAGFVALSQVITQYDTSQWWLIPANYHQPIEQQMVLIKGADSHAEDFYAFLQSEAAAHTIRLAGYDTN